VTAQWVQVTGRAAAAIRLLLDDSDAGLVGPGNGGGITVIGADVWIHREGFDRLRHDTEWASRSTVRPLLALIAGLSGIDRNGIDFSVIHLLHGDPLRLALRAIEIWTGATDPTDRQEVLA